MDNHIKPFQFNLINMYKKQSNVSKSLAAFRRKQRQAEDASLDVAKAIINHVLPIIKGKKK